MNCYVYTKIVNGLELSGNVRAWIKILFIIFATTFFLGKFLERTTPIYLISLVGSIWVGILTIAVTVFVLKDIVCFFLQRIENYNVYIVSNNFFTFSNFCVLSIFWNCC